jgi:hypothetical protein
LTEGKVYIKEKKRKRIKVREDKRRKESGGGKEKKEEGRTLRNSLVMSKWASEPDSLGSFANNPLKILEIVDMSPLRNTYSYTTQA